MARAAQVVAWVRQGHALPDDITTLAGNRSLPWPARSRAAVRDMAFGTIRQLGLGQVLLTGLNRRAPHEAVLALQLVAIEQLIEPMRDVHTIVDQAVQAARERRATRGATGLINAVLRAFLRDKDALLERARQDPVARYNFPRWWIDQVRRENPTHWEQILQVSNQPAPLTLRINQRKVTLTDYLSELLAAGLPARQIGPQALALTRAVDVQRLPGFNQGLASVQDAGAQLAAGLLDVRPGMRVLDACAAPGGKTAHLLEGADIDLLALDKDEQRLTRVADNLLRLGLTGRARLKAADAQQPKAWFDGRLYDRILLDAPCTASGIVRRHPESRWLRRRRDIETHAAQQTQILTGLWPTLKPGGKLLYATCSVFSAEGQGVIDKFLGAHKSARRLPLSAVLDGPDESGQIPASQPVDQLFPVASQQRDHDGFYYALIEKKVT